MKHIIKPIPGFQSEDEERRFWADHNMTEYMEEVKVPVRFSNLKPSSEVISLRLPLSLLDTIKIEAHRRDIPYQSYIKVKLDEVFGRSAHASQ